MGQDHSRSHELALKSAAGDIEGVRRLLALYVQQQRNQSLLSSIPAAQRIDIDHQLPEGDFALELATTHQHVMVVRLLLEHGCNVDAQDSHGLSALMCAAHDRDTAVAVELLRLGRADVHLSDEAGMTALHFACLYGHTDHVRLLLSYGARGVGTLNRARESALDVAVHNAHWDAARIILRHLLSTVGSASSSGSGSNNASSDSNAGINEDTLGPLVQSSLYPAAKAGEWSVVELLLEAGADPHAPCPRALSVQDAANYSAVMPPSSSASTSGPIILDLFPTSMLSTLSLVRAQRRCDRVIALLYPFLVGSILETVIEYEAECWVTSSPMSGALAASSSSSTLGPNARCLALPRTLVYLQRQNEAADRAAESARRLKLAKGLVSQALSSPSPRSSSSNSSAFSHFSALHHDSPFAGSQLAPPREDGAGGVCPSPLSVNPPSVFAASVSHIAPPSQGSQIGASWAQTQQQERAQSSAAASASASSSSAAASASVAPFAREPSITSTSRSPLLLQVEMQSISAAAVGDSGAHAAAGSEHHNVRAPHGRQSSRSSLSASQAQHGGRGDVGDQDDADDDLQLNHVRIRPDSTVAAGPNA